MKNLMLSLLLSVGVGFAMMGSPAQVPDDNVGGKNSTAVQSVTATPSDAIHHGRDLIKKEWKVKKVDAAKLKAPKRVLGQRINISDIKKIVSRGGFEQFRIKDDPVLPPGNGRPNGGGGLGKNLRDRIINSTPTGSRD